MIATRWTPPPGPRPAAFELSFPRIGKSLPPWAKAYVTTAAAGDLGPSGRSSRESEERRRRVLPVGWHTVSQVHGANVVDAAELQGGERGDGLVATPADRPCGVLAMFSADCALVAMASPEGVVGVAHCGWRGLEAGVLQRLGEKMWELGASRLAAIRGPCIGPECYEFGHADLERIARRYGPAVRAASSGGTEALDLPAAVRAATREAGVSALSEVACCTACGEGWFSWRGRGETARFALAVATGP